MIPQVDFKLMNLGTIMMENSSEADVLNSIPQSESIELLLIYHLFNHGWYNCQNQWKMCGDTLNARFKGDIAETFECRYRDKVAKMTSDIMEVELQRRYPDSYYPPQVHAIKSYVIQMMNKKCDR